MLFNNINDGTTPGKLEQSVNQGDGAHQSLKKRIRKIIANIIPETLQAIQYNQLTGYQIGKISYDKRIPERDFYIFGEAAIEFLESLKGTRNLNRAIKILYQIKSLNPGFKFDEPLLGIMRETLHNNSNFSLEDFHIDRASISVQGLMELFIFYSNYPDIALSPQKFYEYNASKYFLSELNYVTTINGSAEEFLDSWSAFFLLCREFSHEIIELIGPPNQSITFIKRYLETGGQLGIFSEISHLRKSTHQSKKILSKAQDTGDSLIALANKDLPDNGWLIQANTLLRDLVDTLKEYHHGQGLSITPKLISYVFDRYSELLTSTTPDRSTQLSPFEILHLPTNERQNSLREWRDSSLKQLNTIAVIIDLVLTNFSVPKNGFTNRIAHTDAIVDKISPYLRQLPIELRKLILTRITGYVSKAHNVDNVLQGYRYHGKPKQLVADIFGVSIKKLQGEIHLERIYGMIVFTVENEHDYELLYTFGENESDEITTNRNIGFALKSGEIPSLNGAVCVIKAKQGYSKGFIDSIKKHELVHLLFPYLIPETESVTDPLVRLKNEILAYLYDGSSTEEIVCQLVLGAKNGSYNYFLDSFKDDQQRYNTLHRLYSYEASISIEIAHSFVHEKIPNALEMLLITPINEWGRIAKMQRVGIYSPNPEVQKSSVKRLKLLKKTCIQRALRDDWKNWTRK